VFFILVVKKRILLQLHVKKSGSEPKLKQHLSSFLPFIE
jgi:hypothetical protein